MKFHINPAIFARYSGLHIGVVIAKGITNTSMPADVLAKLREEEARIQQAYSTETLSQQPKIEVWRKAYQSFGAKPKEHRSSVENLYRLVLQGVQLRHINALVDIYNLISLKHMLPLGGEDLDKMDGDLLLTFAGEAEAPVLLLGDKEARPPHAGEVIYKDATATVCRRWNWREADRTKLTEATTNCILVIEGLPPITKEEIEAATLELKQLVQQHCGGSLVYAVLDEKKQEIQF